MFSVGQRVTANYFNNNPSDVHVQCSVVGVASSSPQTYVIHAFDEVTKAGFNAYVNENEITDILLRDWVRVTETDPCALPNVFHGAVLQVSRISFVDGEARFALAESADRPVLFITNRSSIEPVEPPTSGYSEDISRLASERPTTYTHYRFLLNGEPAVGYAKNSVSLYTRYNGDNYIHVLSMIVISPNKHLGEIVYILPDKATIVGDEDKPVSGCMICGSEADLIPVTYTGNHVACVCKSCRGYQYKARTRLPADELSQMRSGTGAFYPEAAWTGRRLTHRNPLAAVVQNYRRNFEVCDCCGKVFWNAEYTHYRTTDTPRLCEECFPLVRRCAACGDFHYLARMSPNSACDTFYCANCAPHRTFSGRSEYAADYIHCYSYKPNPLFYHTEADGNPPKAYYGVELEIDRPDADADAREECSEALHQIDTLEELFYQKRDGSLRAEGIEIVTHPCSFLHHMNFFPWQKIMQTATGCGYKSHDTTTCGLHIHVSRTAFGDTREEQDLNIAKVLYLFDKFWFPIVRFSRRRSGQLFQYAAKPSCNIQDGDGREEFLRKLDDYQERRNRYVAVNLCNDATVEFRVFRGTLKLSSLYAALQFLQGLIQHVCAHSISEVKTATWQDISRGHGEPELMQYLEERELLEYSEDADEAA